MAYNPYQMIYNPQVYPTPYNPWPQPVQNVPVAQPNQPNSGIIWVQGEAGAKSYLVAANQTVPLWDSESQTIYLKSADASGMPSIKVLEYTIKDQNEIPQTNEAQSSNYVTKDDFDEFANNIQRQLNKIAGKSRKFEED